MRVTIEDVAKKAGVSKSTVSRVMNQNYHHITEEKRQKVFQAIRELDYRPNALAKGLKQMKTSTIGVILSNLQNPFWMKVLEGIEDLCQEEGYSLMIVNSRDNLAREEENVKGFLMRQLDGLIINPSLGQNPVFGSLDDYRVPYLFLNRKVQDLVADTIVVDNIKGVSLAVDHLVGLKRRRIAVFLYPPEGISPRLERIEGYLKALRDNSIEVREDWIKIVRNREDCRREMQMLLEAEERPNAILSTNNMLTLDILESLKESGCRVPEEIGVVGYDETEWSKHLDPPLTTIVQPAYEMGRAAVKRLIERIQAKEQGIQLMAETIELEPSLIVRRSCGGSRD